MMLERSKPHGPSLLGILLFLLPATGLCLLFVAVGVIHVTSRVMVVEAGYRMSQLEQENRALAHTHDKLKLELAFLKSPVRLERLAKEQLGMVPPPAERVIHVEKEASRRAAAPERPHPQATALLGGGGR